MEMSTQSKEVNLPPVPLRLLSEEEKWESVEGQEFDGVEDGSPNHATVSQQKQEQAT